MVECAPPPATLMIPQETIEKVAAATDIVELVGRYVPLKRAGATYKACCPFHPEKTPSFNVNPGRQMFKCFGCGVGGTVFKFLMLRENMDFPAAVRTLAERAGIPIIEDDFGNSEGEHGAGDLRRRLLALHAEAAAWFHRNLMKSTDAQPARDYLRSRGLGGEVAARWQLGYAPDSWDACRRWGESQKFKHDELVKSGLVKLRDEDENAQSSRSARGYDRFRDRLMFPISNEAGNVIGFSGRVLTPEAKGAKYINSPETSLFTKGKVLFGLHMSKKEVIDLGVAIVCEGQIDLITAFEAGIKNVIAPQGTAFTNDQARLLKRHADEVVLCFDADAAGQQAAERSVAVLLESNLSIRVATMPPGEDPDSLIRHQGAMAFAERVAAAQDFFDFQIERLGAMFDLGTPRGKAQFCERIAESVSLLTEPVLREAVVGKVSARLGISALDFRSLLKTKRSYRPKSGGADFRAGDTPEEGAAKTPVSAFERPPNSVVFLLRLALENEEARAWLLDQPWRDLLPQVPGTELLIKALEAAIDVRDLSETSAFLAALAPEEESFLTGQMMEKPFLQPLTVARDSWQDLVRTLLKSRITALESRMRLPDVSTEETTRLQKEILDLQLGLKDITRL